MSVLDRRLNAYRPDLADAALQGAVTAENFSTGELMRVQAPVVDLRSQPRMDSGPQTQLIFGDEVRVFEDADGWSWVKSLRDGYVGYVSSAALDKPGPAPTHMVCVPRSFVYPGPDMRLPITNTLSLGSRICIVGTAETRGKPYLITASGEALIADHLIPIGTPIDQWAGDYVSVAETMIYTPYLWGGLSGFGIDCSGLVQLSMLAAGREVLRDSDMQERSLGEIITPDADYSNLQRGDLVFWKGHVAIMVSPDMMIHANGHTMQVTLEPLKDAIARIAYLYELPTAIRRP